MVYWVVLVIANCVSIIFTVIGLKWMYLNFWNRYEIYSVIEEKFRGLPAVKTVVVLYLAGSILLTAVSVFISFYFNQ